MRQIDRRVVGRAGPARHGEGRIRQIGAKVQDVLSLCHVGSPYLKEFLCNIFRNQSLNQTLT
jgi:hypothetical protein